MVWSSCLPFSLSAYLRSASLGQLQVREVLGEFLVAVSQLGDLFFESKDPEVCFFCFLCEESLLSFEVLADHFDFLVFALG